MKNKLLKLFLMVILITGLTGCTNKNDVDKLEVIHKQNEEKTLLCLENELNNYISSNNESLKSIPMSDVTDKENKIAYYKGYTTNKDNFYIIYKGNITYEWEVMKDFNLYFASKFPIYQLMDFDYYGIYILAHSTSDDIDYKELKSKCLFTYNDNNKKRKIPDDTINKLNETTKMIIKIKNEKELGTITNKESIQEVINAVSVCEQSYGKNIAFLADGNVYDFLMYNDKNELIDTIFIWNDGKRLVPESMNSNYYSLSKTNIDLREIIERETDYIYYGIFDYQEECDQSRELIYEDKDYKYYLSCKKSDKVLINFGLKNIAMTLKYALNNDYIRPDQINTYNELLIKESK